MKKKNVEIVGENAHDLTQDIRTDLAQLGADAAKLASEVIAPRARDLATNMADYVTPRARDLATNVADYVQPLAKGVGQRGAYLAAEARDNLQPRLEHLAAEAPPRIARLTADTRDNLQPYIEEAAALLQPKIHDARARLQPLLDDAYARVEPLVDEGRERFNQEVLPRLTDAYDNVNALPQTKEAVKRLKATRAALVGELEVPEPAAKRSFGKTLLRLILASGLVAGIAYAVKRFLAPEDSGWQAHEPSPAYRSQFESTATPATSEPEPVAEAEAEPAPAPEAPRRAVTEPEPASDAATEADPFVVSPYGEGSYVGTEPPAGFAIKGNERSMKYHVKGTGGYERTIPDVWFASEEAATAAGFTKAQR